MNYIVLDLEWNQPMSPRQMVTQPVPLKGEIIQIGAVRLDEQLNETGRIKLPVKPAYYKILHMHVRKVVQLQQRDLRTGHDFKTAFTLFREWCGEDFVFLTWGYDDIPMLEDNIKMHGLETGWIPRSFNIQTIFVAQNAVEKRQYSLQDALTHYGISQTENVHDALNDASYTAEICKNMDLCRGIGEYDGSLSKHKALFQETYTFRSKRAAFQSRAISALNCPECEGRMPYEGWVRQSSGKFIALATCPEHGDFFSRITFTKYDNGFIHVTKTLFEGSEELREFYNKKLEIQRAREMAVQPEEAAAEGVTSV